MRFASQRLLAWVRLALAIALFSTPVSVNASEPVSEGVSSRDAKAEAIRSIPFNRLSEQASQKIGEVVQRPSFYRRMPTQQIECDPQMFKFLVRRPEVMVNIWDMMGITKVTANRLNQYSFFANDGVGTTCKCDLVYGDNNIHIYVGDGVYDGSMTPRKVTGSCVCVLRSRGATAENGQSMIRGTMDVFLKLDNFGADIITRTLGPFVGKTADHNFVETAKFISQISSVCARSPTSGQVLAMKLDKVDTAVQGEFAKIASNMARHGMSSELRRLQSDDRLGRPFDATSSSQPRSREDGNASDSPAKSSRQSRSPDYYATRSDPISAGEQPSSKTGTSTQVGIKTDSTLDSFANSRSELKPSQDLPLQEAPASRIRPHKPNVYMRR